MRSLSSLVNWSRASDAMRVISDEVRDIEEKKLGERRKSAPSRLIEARRYAESRGD
jgi:hypothetical protein